jgi:hypothetical protein
VWVQAPVLGYWPRSWSYHSFRLARGHTPARPQLAWDQVALIYVVFAIALLITLLALAWIMGRMRLFQAVKLGDAN